VTSAESRVTVVLTTLAADADAAAFARALVDERLAACVNILPPMVSTYAWKGSTAVDREQQLVIKTSAERLAALQAWLLAHHPYETPELLVLHAAASDAYFRWLVESTDPRR
jgi:periplasmic divalent cation tolerance protein